MPIVTIDPEHYDKYELSTAPKDPNVEGDEDGFVMLRPLPYGMKLKIRDQSTKMFMRAQKPENRAERRGRMSIAKKEDDAVLEFETLSEAANYLTFSYCIGGHNLLDSNRNKVDFQSPMAFKQLDPKVGSELEVLIDDLNRGEDEESFEDFQKRSSNSLEGNQSVEDSGENEKVQKIGSSLATE